MNKMFKLLPPRTQMRVLAELFNQRIITDLEDLPAGFEADLLLLFHEACEAHGSLGVVCALMELSAADTVEGMDALITSKHGEELA